MSHSAKGHKKSLPGRAGRSEGSAAGTRPLILYVDDDVGNRVAARLRLERRYEMVEAANDREACGILRERGAELQIILMDIQLLRSQLDGIALVKLIRGKLTANWLPEYARNVPVLDTPVIFLTAYGQRYEREVLLAAGASEIASKPVDFIKLSNAMTHYLVRKTLDRLTP